MAYIGYISTNDLFSGYVGVADAALTATPGPATIYLSVLISGFCGISSPTALVEVPPMVYPPVLFSGFCALTTPTATGGVVPPVEIGNVNALTGFIAAGSPTISDTTIPWVDFEDLISGLVQLTSPEAVYSDVTGIVITDILSGRVYSTTPFLQDSFVTMSDLVSGHVSDPRPFAVGASVPAPPRTPVLFPFDIAQDSFSVQSSVASTVLIELDGGPPRVRKDADGASLYAEAQWTLVGNEYDSFVTLVNGENPIIINVIGDEDYSVYVCEMIPGSLELLSASDDVYVVRAVLEILE